MGHENRIRNGKAQQGQHRLDTFPLVPASLATVCYVSIASAGSKNYNVARWPILLPNAPPCPFWREVANWLVCLP